MGGFVEKMRSLGYSWSTGYSSVRIVNELVSLGNYPEFIYSEGVRRSVSHRQANFRYNINVRVGIHVLV